MDWRERLEIPAAGHVAWPRTEAACADQTSVLAAGPVDLVGIRVARR